MVIDSLEDILVAASRNIPFKDKKRIMTLLLLAAKSTRRMKPQSTLRLVLEPLFFLTLVYPGKLDLWGTINKINLYYSTYHWLDSL